MFCRSQKRRVATQRSRALSSTKDVSLRRLFVRRSVGIGKEKIIEYNYRTNFTILYMNTATHTRSSIQSCRRKLILQIFVRFTVPPKPSETAAEKLYGYGIRGGKDRALHDRMEMPPCGIVLHGKPRRIPASEKTRRTAGVQKLGSKAEKKRRTTVRLRRIAVEMPSGIETKSRFLRSICVLLFQTTFCKISGACRLDAPRICAGIHFLKPAVLPVFLHKVGIAAAFYNGAAVYD